MFSLVLVLTILLPTVGARAIYSIPDLIASNHVVIMQLQTGGAGPGTATEEYLLLFNPTITNINVTDWCVEYSSANDNVGFESCVQPPDALTELWLTAGGFMSFSTTSFDTANPDFVADATFAGGMSGTSGHLRLFDAEEIEVDKVGWGVAINPETTAVSTHDPGEVLSRSFLAEQIDTNVNFADFSSQPIKETVMSGLYEQEIIVDLCSNIDGVQQLLPEYYLPDADGNCFEDICLNLEGLQVSTAAGYEKLAIGSDCTLVPLESAVLYITEILPNAPSTDTGQEFIEIYNPNPVAVELNGYKIQVGPAFTKEFVIVSGQISPGQYLIFSDTATGIVLPNTTGVQLRLVAPAGNVVSNSAIYSSADDSESWALIEDQWIYTNQITPGAANKPFLIAAVDEVEGVTSVQAPCPADKLRNPATNRCKTIETAASQLVPCATDEFRNPDTNRCNKISSSSFLAACPEGQERNSETNRCRNASTLGSIDGNIPTVTDIAVENTEGTVDWGIISAAFLGTLGYTIYEWRGELRHKLRFRRFYR
jgi:hypothetical protein